MRKGKLRKRRVWGDENIFFGNLSVEGCEAADEKRGRERGVQGGAKLPPLTEEAFRKVKGICKNTDSLFA